MSAGNAHYTACGVCNKQITCMKYLVFNQADCSITNLRTCPFTSGPHPARGESGVCMNIVYSYLHCVVRISNGLYSASVSDLHIDRTAKVYFMWTLIAHEGGLKLSPSRESNSGHETDSPNMLTTVLLLPLHRRISLLNDSCKLLWTIFYSHFVILIKVSICVFYIDEENNFLCLILCHQNHLWQHSKECICRLRIIAMCDSCKTLIIFNLARSQAWVSSWDFDFATYHTYLVLKS